VPIAPWAASAPVPWPAGFCFCTAVLGSTLVPLAEPDVLPGCPLVVPCCADAFAPSVISAPRAAPSKRWWLFMRGFSRRLLRYVGVGHPSLGRRAEDQRPVLWRVPRAERLHRRGDAAAEAQSTFSLACTFKGGAANFVVSGDCVKGEAMMSRRDGSFARGYVTWDHPTPPNPTLAMARARLLTPQQGARVRVARVTLPARA
jgi:hypothetical protein